MISRVPSPLPIATIKAAWEAADEGLGWEDLVVKFKLTPEEAWEIVKQVGLEHVHIRKSDGKNRDHEEGADKS